MDDTGQGVVGLEASWLGLALCTPVQLGRDKVGWAAWTVLHSLKARIWDRTGREPGGTKRGRRPGLNAPRHCTGRSSNMTLETTGACRREGGKGRVEELPVDQWDGGGRALSALWFGMGRGLGWDTSVRLSVCPACLLAGVQSFHSFLMVRFHSHDR